VTTYCYQLKKVTTFANMLVQITRTRASKQMI